MADSAKKEKANKPSFFKGLKAEYKKIVWPDRNEAVCCCCLHFYRTWCNYRRAGFPDAVRSGFPDKSVK